MMTIDIAQLSQIYPGGFAALRDIDLTIRPGLFGLLGPNGAGKTTLMRILVTLMAPSSGTVSIAGYDLARDRRRIRALTGYLPQGFSTFPKVRTWEFLDYSARLAGLRPGRRRRQRVEELLDSVGLLEARDRLANRLSGGMKRRLGIAQALIGDPRILVVDEPTTGLDPEERIRFRNILSEMAGGERIIILSTHIVGDISSTCTDMALLVQGEIGFQGPPERLIDQARGHAFEWIVRQDDLPAIKSRYPVIATIPDRDGWRVQVVSATPPTADATVLDPHLEHAYVWFMEERAADAEAVLADLPDGTGGGVAP